MVTPSGLEPETPVLKARCSKPIELRGHNLRLKETEIMAQKRPYLSRIFVTPEGFEPPLSGPKPLVLPLDERVIYCCGGGS